ncbi:CehA/McbA family metallohydrolase domain-containing protein [Cyclobacterium salsum]|uniref:hypothetical protein n=1 Tax=Cyclobacterium salsum TaxID=2666329 RepID=UPI001390E694|nr:hypothetical protein [Cyclobacterium salsum]
MRPLILCCLLIFSLTAEAQTPVDFTDFDKNGTATATVANNVLEVTWPISEVETGKLLIALENENALLESIQVGKEGEFTEIARSLDPVFILTEGKRDLTKGSGWNIFFDKTAYLPHTPHVVNIQRKDAKVTTEGSRTKISITEAQAAHFSGTLELTLYAGSPLLNLAAVMETKKDSVAIIYDAGLVSRDGNWEEVFWSDTKDYLQAEKVDENTPAKALPVKYRTVIGESIGGSLAVFPPPHQYFYPLDNAYNLKHTWFGTGYRDLIPGFGIGIRHDLLGDRRHVPWFNAPPGTEQRLNFFVVVSTEKDGQVLEMVKKFTHADRYRPLPGYRTMASHFHTEHIDDVLTHKPLPEIPGHVRALRNLGVNIMHLGEFHLAGNPRDHGPRRLPEFRLMFEECARLSTGDFLMLPGEEPNSHFGGHWMNIFPKPVYWIMSRETGQPFVEEDPAYGKVYRVGNKEEMLELLEVENGLAWTAHARTKGSTGFPDQYREESFFQSDRFLGAAWKAIPADLSQPRLGKRVLDLMDDMANWGHKKYVIGEADLFKLEPDYEIYGHMNINYLQMEKLPKFEDGWQPVLDAMEEGRFFVTTGEVLIPAFSVNGKSSGEVLKLDSNPAKVTMDLEWTFPLNFVEIISGDGDKVFRERVSMKDTRAFGKENFIFPVDLNGRTWVRVEAWDVAANGAFTQFLWLE